MTEPTPRQLAVLVAYIEAGGARGAAERLGMHPTSVRMILAELHQAFDAANTAQAFAIAVQRGHIDPLTLRLPEAA